MQYNIASTQHLTYVATLPYETNYRKINEIHRVPYSEVVN